jgi:hypothetical protein
MSILFNEIADSIYICAREHIEGGGGAVESSRAGRTGRAASGAQRRGARPRHSVRARRGTALSARQRLSAMKRGR